MQKNNLKKQGEMTYEQTDMSALLPKPKTAYTVTWTEKIRCPECHKIQLATVTETPLWNIYIHECECGYIIGESEWCVSEE